MKTIQFFKVLRILNTVFRLSSFSVFSSFEVLRDSLVSPRVSCPRSWTFILYLLLNPLSQIPQLKGNVLEWIKRWSWNQSIFNHNRMSKPETIAPTSSLYMTGNVLPHSLHLRSSGWSWAVKTLFFFFLAVTAGVISEGIVLVSLCKVGSWSWAETGSSFFMTEVDLECGKSFLCNIVEKRITVKQKGYLAKMFHVPASQKGMRRRSLLHSFVDSWRHLHFRLRTGWSQERRASPDYHP